jgi:hypothetical protein
LKRTNKTAELLARPILHATKGKEHTFYIIDKYTKYQHKTRTYTKPKIAEMPLDKLIAPYKNLIIEAKEPPKTTPETTIINVATIQELAKTAEILAKPIILTRKPQPTLTIIDNNTIYQHKP